MVTVNQWNWRLVVCWGWTSTTNGESKTPNDIVSVDRRSRRPTGPELRVDHHGISWFISQPSKPPGSSKTKKHPGDSLSKFHSLNNTKTQQPTPKQVPRSVPRSGPRCRAVAPGHSSLRLEYQNRRSASRATAMNPKDETPVFFSAKKKNVHFKKLRHDQQNATCKMLEQLRISSYIQKNSKKTI